MIKTLAKGGGFLAAALLFLCLSSASVEAQQRPDPLGFSIEAVDFPSFFRYDARPGQTVRGTVRVRSTTVGPRIAFLRAVDARTAATGGLEYGDQSRPPTGMGRWIRLAARTVRLPGGASQEVPFSVRVPPGTRAGDHVAGIVAFGREPRTPRGRRRFRLRFVSRLAIAVQIQVPGPRRTREEVRDAEVLIQPSGASLGLKIVNTGNTLIRQTSGRITVSSRGRRLFTRRVRIDSFLPETEIVHPLPWRGTPVEGDYRITGVLRPRGGPPVRIDREASFGRERIREFREETGRPAVEAEGTSPWVLVALAAALLAVAGLAVAYLRLRRRANAES